MNKIHTLYQLNQRFSLSISVRWDLPIGESPWDGPNGKLQGSVRVGAGNYVKMCKHNVAAGSLT